MNRIVGTLVLTSALAGAAWAQLPTPTPLPADSSDVVKISTNLVQIDVTVKDRKGNVVTDLRPDEIEIFQNGKKQQISNFSFISNIGSKDEVEKPKEEKGKPTVVLPTSVIKADQVRRTLALVVDDFTLSFESTHYVRRALKKFVDEQMQDGDLVAIIQARSGIGALQQFTNDKRRLNAAIERIRWNAMGTGGLGALDPIVEPMPGELPALTPDDRTAAAEKDEAAQYRNSVYASDTLAAVDYVIRGMQELPGRKAILLLTDGFTILETQNGVRSMSTMLSAVKRLGDVANRASVVINTLDARGLVYFGITAVDDPQGRTPQQLDDAINARRSDFQDTQDGPRLLAKETGGTAIYNSNDLRGGIRKILDDQSYYLIGYQPEEESFNPKMLLYNRLEVRVKRPGMQVNYRNGFLGVTDDSHVVKPPKTVDERMFHSLSSPFAVNDITLRLNALFYKPPNFSDTFVRSFVHIPGKDLTFTDEPGGEKKAVFDVIAAGFGDNGTYVDRVSKTYTIVLTKEAYDRVMNQGLVYEFSFPVKTAGAYQFRISLHDHGNDKIGSAHQFIEVPNLKKGRMVLSGVVLDNIPYGEYQRQIQGNPAQPGLSDSLVATSLRQFRSGSVLTYGFNIYNAKLVGSSPNLSFQTRIFRDGKAIFEGSPEPVVPTSVQLGTVGFSGALALGTSMVPGEYVLQVMITDKNLSSKKNTATQFVLFDVID